MGYRLRHVLRRERLGSGGGGDEEPLAVSKPPHLVRRMMTEGSDSTAPTTSAIMPDARRSSAADLEPFLHGVRLRIASAAAGEDDESATRLVKRDGVRGRWCAECAASLHVHEDHPPIQTGSLLPCCTRTIPADRSTTSTKCSLSR